MEINLLPPVDASKAPMRPFNLPNTPVIALPKMGHRAVPVPKTEKTHDHAPKTKPSYGMTQPYKACIHGVKGPYAEH